MPLITKIHKEPVGEFTIKFSTRLNKFEIEYPTDRPEVLAQLNNQVIHRNHNLLKWDDVEAEIQSIIDQYRTKILMTRKVIIIRLQTSESNYEFENTREWFGKVTTEQKKYDRLNDVEGFALQWYVAEEYQYPQNNRVQMGKNSLRYKIIETNKNCKRFGTNLLGKPHDYTNILPQLMNDDDGHGSLRIFTYTDDLYQFLQEVQESIATMLHRMIDYFSVDPQKFLNNVEQKVKLLSDGK
jgi:hypothetical protein